MGEITTVGLDLAKHAVSLCGEDAGGHGRRALHESAEHRLAAQGALHHDAARVLLDRPTRPDTELQSDPSSRDHLLFRGSPCSK